MRVALLATLGLAFALAGCMHMSGDDEDWEPYGSGRGLAFGTVLTILLVTGVAVLIANLSGQKRSPPQSPQQPQPPQGPPPADPPAGWELIEPEAAAPPAPPTRAARKATKPAKSKPAKPRRRGP